MILKSSDWHCGPEGLSEDAKEFIRKGKALGATLVGNGDLFNLLPIGFDAFVNCAAIRQFEEEIGDYQFYYVAGNHDPYKWVKKLFGHMPNVTVKRHVELDRFYFTHGHPWSFDWWLLRHIAPQLVTFMVDVFPNQWNWFCGKVGWLPGKIKEDVKQERRETTDYGTAVGKVWDAALKHAQKNDQIVIVGHTHCSGRMLGAIEYIITTVFADGGLLKDTTYMRIEESKASLLYLWDAPNLAAEFGGES